MKCMNKHAGAILKSTALTATVMTLVATGSAFAPCAHTTSAVVGPGRPQPTPAPRTETTFRPNYDRALSVGQMSAAWQAELDRLFPQPVTGGG
jgi:phage tail tape-measure protein